MENKESIEISESALVHCPLADFKLRRVKDCPACPKFGGLEDRFPDAPYAFGTRYLLLCFGAPVKRLIETLDA